MKDGITLIIAVYVDDILIVSSDGALTNRLKSVLSSKFKMKDIGEASSILGINIVRDRKHGVITIDQSQYIKKVLERFGMHDSNPAASPLDHNQRLSNEMSPKNQQECEAMRNIPYQEAIGSIMYAAQLTRPDISFAVSILSRFNRNPGNAHWVAVILLGAAISWNTKRQPTVALSTTEAEYMSLSAATQEAIWLKTLSDELFTTGAMLINCDNKGAICLASDTMYHKRTKHISIRYHFVRERIADGSIKLQYIPINEMVADILTKATTPEKTQTLSAKFGLKY